ncbi:MAG: hypothetical protein LBL18_04880 [Bacteroidales bacterium]|jgi:hypothetical protein|nr:hypothetical protein [Bacteroidales bacterium]
MDNQEITLLIERYFEGLTTTAEETQLRHYFQQAQIADNLLIYKPLFVALSDLREMPQPLIHLPKTAKKNHFTSRLKIVSIASGFAAALIIGFFALFYESTTANYVMIDGRKYTDKTLIMHNFEQSLDNVKIDMNDMLSEFQTLDIEP